MAKDKGNISLKTPKGTRDWQGSDVVLRDSIFNAITEVFKRHGGVTIDTPVFELKEILTGKYGEDSKLIYDLADQGGEITSLRYDLTVPFARWLAMNQSIGGIKRYHIAKVYRRDQPAIAKGRMREFYQCDFDIAGPNYDPMLPDAEILKIISEVFKAIGWAGTYTIKLNHRKVLEGMMAVCGVPEDKLRAISSAIDKLDKSPWEEVRREMTEDKGLDPAVADKIGEFVQPTPTSNGADGVAPSATTKEDPRKVLERLQASESLNSNASAKKGLEELALLFEYLDIWGVLDEISLDMSLARGLDYYTGLIYEVVTEGSAPKSTTKPQGKKSKSSGDPDEDRSSDPSIGVGSVAAGGRYDDLVGMFSKKGQIPCVGISFGVDRIFGITKARMEKETANAVMRTNEVDVYIMAFGGDGCLPARMQIAQQLWDGKIKAEFMWKKKPKLPPQFKAAESAGVPLAVIVGEDELRQGMVKIKVMGAKEGDTAKEGVLVERDELVEEIRKRLGTGESVLTKKVEEVKLEG
ncbi:hypothetical protein BLS_008876 [Venturia inaequalis]|uniref:Histidine--tRNA ligase, mitochondrial n=1 Tax=Venturia inaequalis TaxID=5025 RepID=A0A8H3V0S0_VENIN|nr:hypothetical protein BLS_008876 [Venturia inaequalis]